MLHWTKNVGEQQYLTRKDGRYKQCGDRQTEDGPGKNPGHKYRHSDTHTRRRTTKKALLFGFASSTEPTIVIGARDIVIDPAN